MWLLIHVVTSMVHGWVITPIVPSRMWLLIHVVNSMVHGWVITPIVPSRMWLLIHVVTSMVHGWVITSIVTSRMWLLIHVVTSMVHGWVITSHYFTWMYLLIPVVNLVWYKPLTCSNADLFFSLLLLLMGSLGNNSYQNANIFIQENKSEYCAWQMSVVPGPISWTIFPS